MTGKTEPATETVETVKPNEMLLSIVATALEAAENTSADINSILPVDRDAELMGIGWRPVDKLMTLLSYTFALIGASVDDAHMRELQNAYSAIHWAMRRQRRIFYQRE